MQGAIQISVLAQAFGELAESIGKVVESCQRAAHQTARFLKECKDFQLLMIRQGMTGAAYQMAGYPYGNNRRGKKRWAREMKRESA